MYDLVHLFLDLRSCGFFVCDVMGICWIIFPGLWDRKVVVVSQAIDIVCEPLTQVRRYVRIDYSLGQFQRLICYC